MTANLEPSKQLAEIEALILQYRSARDRPGTPEWQTLHVLKTIAGDLRGRARRQRSDAHSALSGCVDAAQKHRPIPNGQFIRIGQEVLRFWPTVRQALEHYQEKTQ